MNKHVDTLRRYAVTPPGESPPRIMPWDQSSRWGIEGAARSALGLLLEHRSWSEQLAPYAEYLLAFITPATNQTAGVDALLLNATALALSGYMADGDHPDADIWRRTGCARLATEAHRRRADIQDQTLTDCLTAVNRTAEECGAPILADLLTLDERMHGRLLDHSRAERLEVLEEEYPDHLTFRLKAEEVGTYMRARDWQRATANPEYLMNARLDEALAACANRITLTAHMYVRHQFGRDVNWHLQLFEDKESTVSLNNHRWIRDMAGAWINSRDARLPAGAARHLMSWYTACPTPNHKQLVGPWRTLEVGNRMCNQWRDVFAWLGETEPFDDTLHSMYARSRLEHMRYLAAYCGGPNNWYQVESSGMAVAALLSPEVSGWETYLDLAMRRLEWINSFAYFDDGFQFELTTGYHMYPTYSMFNVLRVARARGVELPEDYVQLMEKAHEMYLYAAKPDFTLPRVNDTSPGIVDGTAHLQDAAEMFDRNDFLYGGTRGEHGVVPDHASHSWPHAGYYCQRSDWSTDARFLFFDSAPWGASHQHEDKLTFVLHAFGRTLLGDPSIYSYAQTELTHYFRSSRAHNVVLIDGLQQARRLRPESKLRTQGRQEWVSKEGFDFVSGEYLEGYAADTFADWVAGRPDATVDEDLSHRRAVFFVKPDYFVLCDIVTDRSASEAPRSTPSSETHRLLEQLFHIPPQRHENGESVPGEVSVTDSLVRTTDAGKANLAIVPVDTEGLSAHSYLGETGPARGWYSMSGEVPAWEIAFSAKRPLPARMDTILWPQPPGELRVPTVERVYCDGVTTALRVTTATTDDASGGEASPQGIDIDDLFILCEEDAGIVRVDDIEFEGRALLLRGGGRGPAYGIEVKSALLGGEQITVRQ